MRATGQPQGNALNPQQQLQPGVGSGLQGAVVYRFHAGREKTLFNVEGNAGIREFNSKLDPHGLWFRNFDVSTGISTKLTPNSRVAPSGTRIDWRAPVPVPMRPSPMKNVCFNRGARLA